MQDKTQWEKNEETHYHRFFPEYTLLLEDTERDKPEFYSYMMTNESTNYGMIRANYYGTTLYSHQTVWLDGGRYKNGPCDEAFAKRIFNCLNNVCNELLRQGMAHRDIKPENIMITDKNEIVLMDLGVLKIIGNIDLTDIDGHTPFIATLKYAPPELLLRNEIDTLDGWKSINIYQIGATLHDVIMGYELFKQYEEPYGLLVMAVKESKPRIEQNDYNQDFIILIRNMLIKDWKERLAVFASSDIDAILSSNVKNAKEDLLAKLKSLQAGYTDDNAEIDQLRTKRIQEKAQLEEMCNRISEVINTCFQGLQSKNIIAEHPTDANELASNLRMQRIKRYIVKGRLSQGFVAPVNIYIQYPDKYDVCNVNILGEIAFSNVGLNGPLRFTQVYTGEFDEHLFTEKLTELIYKVIYVALEKMKPYVEKEFEWEKQISGVSGIHTRVSSLPKNIIIDDLLIGNK